MSASASSSSIENRPGAGGIVAAKAGAAAPPDGYTLSLTGNHTAISRSLFKTIPYDILTEFTSVSIIACFDLMLATRAEFRSSRCRTSSRSRAPIRASLNIGSINPGSTQNLVGGAARGRDRLKVDDRAVPHLARDGDRAAARRRRRRASNI